MVLTQVLLLICISTSKQLIPPDDFLVSKIDYGTSAILSESTQGISFYTFSGAITSDTYTSNIREITIQSKDSFFISSKASKSEHFPSDRVYYGFFKHDISIFIYGGLGADDIKSDLWYYDTDIEVWYDMSDYMVFRNFTRVPGRYDFAFVSFNISKVAIVGGIGAESSALTSCFLIDVGVKQKVLVSDCLDFSQCTGMGLSGAQVKYYKGKLYLFSGINIEEQKPRYFTGLCVLDLEKMDGWKKVEIEKELVSSHRGGSVVYGEQLLYFFGSYFMGNKQAYNSKVFALDLNAPEKGWSRLNFNSSIGCDSFSYILHEDTVLIFGGLCTKGTQQILTKLSLSTYETKSFSLLTPTHRIGSSLLRSTGRLYLFGGESENLYHSSIWQYNPKLDENVTQSSWVHLDNLISTPSPRKHAASSSQGYFHLIAGGVDAAGKFLDDFWILNTNTQTWFQLVLAEGTDRPPGFAHACLILRVPYFYLIGGLNSEKEVMKEVWRYDFTKNSLTKVKNLFSGQFPGKYEMSCFYQKWRNNSDQKKESIFVFFGKNDATGRSNCTIGRIDLIKYWYSYFELSRSGEMQCSTSSAFYYEKDKLVVVGGKGLTGKAIKDIWVLTLNETHVVKEDLSEFSLESPVYGSSYKTMNKDLYLFSGFSTNGNSKTAGATDLVYKIDIENIIHTKSCDIGFDRRSGTCQKCPKGTFSSSIEKDCENCEPHGTLTVHEGSTSGVECLIEQRHMNSSLIPFIEKAIGFNFTEEPQAPIYTPPDLLFFYVPFVIVMFLFITVFLSIFFSVKNFALFIIENSLLSDLKVAKVKPLPKVGDLEQPLLSNEKAKEETIRKIAKKSMKKKMKHKERKLAKKIKRKSANGYSVKDFIGGLMTGLIILTLVAILIYLPVDYVSSNKKEKNELIPTVTFLNQFKDLDNSLTLNIVTYPFNYGSCSVHLEHSKLQNVTLRNTTISYTKSNNVSVPFACHLYLKVNNSKLYNNDFIFLDFRDKNIYAKNIYVWAEAESAKFGFKSRYFQEVKSTIKHSFDGRKPTVFKLLIVPAYFQDEAYFSKKVNNSGLIIHSNEVPRAGSQIEDSHLQLGSSLSLKISLVASESSMLTSFYLQIGLVKFLSTLAAQIIGIFGVFEAAYIGIQYLLIRMKQKKKELQRMEEENEESSDEEEKKVDSRT